MVAAVDQDTVMFIELVASSFTIHVRNDEGHTPLPMLRFLVPFGVEKENMVEPKQVPYDISQTLSGGDKARFFCPMGPGPEIGALRQTEVDR